MIYGLKPGRVGDYDGGVRHDDPRVSWAGGGSDGDVGPSPQPSP